MTLDYKVEKFNPVPVSDWDKIKEDKEIKKQSFVEFVEDNKTYRGVVQEQEEDGRWEVLCTSRLIKKENYFKLYESSLPVWICPTNNLKKIECDCYRVESGYKWAFCPDCHWDCVS